MAETATYDEIMLRMRKEINIFYKERRQALEGRPPKEDIYIHDMVDCPCGGFFKKKHLRKHLETKKHKKWELQN